MDKKVYYINDMCFYIPFKKLRNTPNVEFDLIVGVIDNLASIDRVKHEKEAYSPTIEGHDDWFWYMHPNQEDNLVVFEGTRLVELYTKEHNQIEKFEVTPNYVKHNDNFVYEGRCVFGWPINVFHRIRSPQGSVSANFAKHFEGFDIRTNFNIYDLNASDFKLYVINKRGKKIARFYLSKCVVKDTVFYSYNKLLSLNEVGGEPDFMGLSIDEFFEFLKNRKEQT